RAMARAQSTPACGGRCGQDRCGRSTPIGVASASLPLRSSTGIPRATPERSASPLCLHQARSQLTLRPVAQLASCVLAPVSDAGPAFVLARVHKLVALAATRLLVSDYGLRDGACHPAGSQLAPSAAPELATSGE